MQIGRIKLPIILSQNQKRFINCKDNKVLLISPARAGKSESLITKIIKNGYNSDGNSLVTAPTFRQIYSVLEQEVVRRFDRLCMIKRYNKQDFIELVNGNIIYFRSGVDPDTNYRGLNVKQIFADEITVMSKYAYEVLLGRMFTSDAQINLVGTPKGKSSWVYDMFFGEQGERKEFTYLRYNIKDNPLISDEIINGWKESLDEKTFEQEVNGKWITIGTGQVYFAWNEECISNEAVYNPNFPTYIGADFNIGLNCWVALQRLPTKQINVFTIGSGTLTTPDMGRQILQKLEKLRVNEFYVIPDSTGGAREKGSGQTQFQLLQQAGIQHINTTFTNPHRQERYAVVNAGLTNALGQHLIKIHPSCKELIYELRDLSYKKGLSNDIDTQGGKVGHITDALGYPVYYITGGQVEQMKKVENNYVHEMMRRTGQSFI
jgi:hypothetical protein